MSRDSSATYIHLHSSRLADVFEEFCRPPSSTVFAPAGSTTTTTQQQTTTTTSHANSNTNAGTQQGTLADGSGMTALPGHYLPFEEISLPQHLMPINPEDEDDVVPDMHAAFGINRALNQSSSTAGAQMAGAAGMGASGARMGGSGEPTGEASHAGVTREPIWRDLGLEGLMADLRSPRGMGGDLEGVGRRREGKRTGLLLLR